MRRDINTLNNKLQFVILVSPYCPPSSLEPTLIAELPVAAPARAQIPSRYVFTPVARGDELGPGGPSRGHTFPRRAGVGGGGGGATPRPERRELMCIPYQVPYGY